ncbi:conserved protein of unknown function [Cupriavidus taiwanensis]|nr:conserved protein of unknown function [Cupriavidus taiwanensis]
MPGQMLEDIVAANPARRVLRGGLGLSLVSAFGSGLLPHAAVTTIPLRLRRPHRPLPGTRSGAATPSYEVTFEPIAKSTPIPWSSPAATAWTCCSPPATRSKPALPATPAPSSRRPRPSARPAATTTACTTSRCPASIRRRAACWRSTTSCRTTTSCSDAYNAATASPEQKRIALSAVGISVIEVELAASGKWQVKRDSIYNKRYTGNTCTAWAARPHRWLAPPWSACSTTARAATPRGAPT